MPQDTPAPEQTTSLTLSSGNVAKIRHLRIKHYLDFIRVMDDEPGQAKFLTGLDPDNLPDRDIVAIVEEGERINSEFFAWAARRKSRLERMTKSRLEDLPAPAAQA